MTTRWVLLLGSLPALLATVAPADTGSDFAKLMARRDALLAAMEKKPATQESLLRFDQGADRDDAWITLRRGEGAWRVAFSEVPGWHQACMKDWRSYYHGNFTGGCSRPNLRFPADASGLTLDAKKLSGSLGVAYRLDMPYLDRLPPGEHHQYWDRFIPGGHTAARNVSYAIDAEVHAERAMLDLILENGVYWDPAFAPLIKAASPAIVRRPIHVRLQVPSTRFTAATAKTPSWVHGFHEADATSLKYEAGRLTGALVIRLHQDGWMPWGGGKHVQHEPITIRFALDARLEGNELSGKYKASFGGFLKGQIMYPKGDQTGDVTLPDTRYEGAVRGRGGKLVIGRYSTKGDLGEQSGAIDGMLLDSPRPARETAKVPEGEMTAERISAVLHQVRAIHLALQHAPLSLEEATKQTSWPSPAGASPEEYLRLALQQVDALPAPDAKIPAAKTETVGDSPSFGAKAADVENETVNVLAADSAGWMFLPKWQVIGTFEQRLGLEHDTALAPDLVVIPGAAYQQTMDRSGVPIDSPAEQRWQAVTCADPRLGAPWERTGPFPRYVGQVWYGAATLRSAQARTVWLGLGANDFAKLWVNDKLVWTAAESTWRYRAMGRTFVPVPLVAGENRLLARIHSDRNLSWLRLALTTAEPATPAVPTARPPVNKEYVFPDAKPPLAWDIAKGINVTWRDEGLGGSTRPLVLGDAVYVSSGAGTLTCIDLATGKKRWTKQLGEEPSPAAGKGQPSSVSAPVTDGSVIAILSGPGVLGCYDSAGKLLCSHPTSMPNGRLWPCGKHFIVEIQVSRGDRGRAAEARLIAFDPSTGKEAWRRDVPGLLQRTGMAVTVGGSSFALSGTGKLLDAQTGQPAAGLDCEMQMTDKDGMALRDVMGGVYKSHVSAEQFYITSQARNAAVRLWARDGKLGFAHAWESNYGNSGFGNVFAQGMSNERFLFTWHSSLAHTPHSPDPRAEVNVHDIRDGRWLGRLKPVMDDLYCYGPLCVTTPVIADKYVYLLAGRSDNKRNQIAIVTADERIQLIARQDAEPGTVNPPVFAGGRMILRSPTSLLCISATTPDGKQYEKLQLARTLLRVIGRERQYPSPVDIKPLDRVSLPLGDIPIGPFADERPTDRWLGAGPFAPDALAKLDVPPVVTTGTTIAGKPFQVVSRQFAYDEPPAYLRTSELQGTGDTTPHFITRVDPRCVSSEKEAGLLYTVIDNTHDRLVLPALNRKGVTQWLGGKLLDPDVPLRLAPGLYPYLVRVTPEFYQVPNPKDTEVPPPVNVVAALEKGVLKAINWPTKWMLLGPTEVRDSILGPEQLKAVPQILTLDGNPYRLYPFTVESNVMDLDCLTRAELGVEPDRSLQFVRPGRPIHAYAFAEVECPADGYLYITAAADAVMAWYVDGVSVYDRMKLGAGPANELGAHPFAVPLRGGRHVLAVLLGPSGAGWTLRSLGGFSEKRGDELPDFRVESKQPKETIDYRLNACFREIAHTPTMRLQWLSRIRAGTDRLRAVVEGLPGAPEAQAAAALLKAGAAPP